VLELAEVRVGQPEHAARTPMSTTTTTTTTMTTRDRGDRYGQI